jgi:hypothetical protein
LSLYPIDGLELNVVFDGGPANLNTFFSRTQFTASYAIDGIGKFFASFLGEGKDDLNYYGGRGSQNGQIGASFLLDGPVDGLQAQIGFSMILADTDATGAAKDVPVRIGLGVHYSGGEWGVKFRGAMELNHRTKDGTYITGDIMPWYSFGFMEAFLDFGLIMINGADKIGVSAITDSSRIGWWLNPYVTVPIVNGKFQIGLNVASGVRNSATGSNIYAYSGGVWDVADKEAILFSVPLRFVYSF